MGMLIKFFGTPVMRFLDALVSFRISWVPVGILLLYAMIVFAVMGISWICEISFSGKDDDSAMDKTIVKEICLALSCALTAVMVTEVPGESFMLSSIASDMDIGNFSQWHGMSKFFLWCGVINAVSIIITQVIISRRIGVIFTLLLTCFCGAAFGHTLIPLILWLCDVFGLFAIVLPLAEALLIGAMYLGSVFGIIPIDIADTIARSAEKQRRRNPNRHSDSEVKWDIWDEAAASAYRAAEEASRENEYRKPRVEVTRQNGYFTEYLKVSSDGERYYDDRDGEWHRVDQIGK